MAAGDFSRACSHVSVLFGCLGIAFKFAEMDYVAKYKSFPAKDLVESDKNLWRAGFMTSNSASSSSFPPSPRPIWTQAR